jgi:hypothetical protein
LETGSQELFARAGLELDPLVRITGVSHQYLVADSPLKDKMVSQNVTHDGVENRELSAASLNRSLMNYHEYQFS